MLLPGVISRNNVNMIIHTKLIHAVYLLTCVTVDLLLSECIVHVLVPYGFRILSHCDWPIYLKDFYLWYPLQLICQYLIWSVIYMYFGDKITAICLWSVPKKWCLQWYCNIHSYCCAYWYNSHVAVWMNESTQHNYTHCLSNTWLSKWNLKMYRKNQEL